MTIYSKLKVYILTISKNHFQQQNSAMFTVTNDIDGTYDAYKKDIAIAAFFFEEPVAYEYSR